MEHVAILQGLTDQQRLHFQTEYNAARKDTTMGFLLVIFLGGIGVQYFYLDKNGAGILCLLFFWTFIPTLLAIIDLFLISGKVKRYNAAKAQEIATTVRALVSRSALDQLKNRTAADLIKALEKDGWIEEGRSGATRGFVKHSTKSEEVRE